MSTEDIYPDDELDETVEPIPYSPEDEYYPDEISDDIHSEEDDVENWLDQYSGDNEGVD